MIGEPEGLELVFVGGHCVLCVVCECTMKLVAIRRRSTNLLI